MKRLTVIGAAVLAAVAALIFTVGLPGTATARPHRFDFTVVAHDDKGSVTPADFFTSPPVQNDQASIDAPVYRRGVKVGRAETIVTYTRVSPNDVQAMIECSVELRGGIVLFNGAFHGADLGTGVTLPVVGGTGKYARAAGVVTMVANADGTRTRLHFRFVTG